MALACETKHVQGHVVTIDDFDPDTGGGYVTPSKEETEKNIARLGLTEYITIIEGESASMASKWVGPPIDLLFHDASHFYAQVKDDIEAWLPNMKPGGLMAFHDYTGEGEGQIGVSRAANEMLGKPIHVSQRLGIFRVKTDE
jgi:predicted O-methyltransferase YrrM